MQHPDPAEDLAFAIREETATALGKAGRQLKRAVDTLADYDRTATGHRMPKHRERLLRDAVQALHGYVIQKELLGIADNDTLSRVYGITPELCSVMGAIRRSSAS